MGTNTINNVKNSLASIFYSIVRKKFAVALYKLPHSQSLHLIAHSEARQINGSPEIEKINGFLMAPFQANGQDKTILIDPSIHIIVKDGKLNILQNKSGIELEEDHMVEKYWNVSNGSIPANEIGSKKFTDAVASAQTEISEHGLKKVVLSRTQTKVIQPHFSPLAFFEKLCAEYPAAFVNLVSAPDCGTWIGATPEVLLKIDKDNVFHTVALAATKFDSSGGDISKANWTQKEIEEQALVSRYILNCFKKIRVREYEDVGPRTIKQGNLLHLKTDYTVNINEINFENLGSVMLDLLHPTSAVCGMPKEIALEVISKCENHSRAYYSGYLGAVNMPSEDFITQTDLFVNLRCMQLLQDEAIFYAGAGITADSDPESEYIETENKFNVLLDVFNKI